MGNINAINVDNEYDQGTRVCKLPSLSVYTYDWKWTTWRGFWRNIKQWFDNRRAAKQRATRGYCGGDIWNCGNTICQKMAHMLTHYRNHCNSWPDRYFSTFKEWIEYIDKIIDLLEFAETDPDELNDYWEPYREAIHSGVPNNDSDEYKKLLENYWNESKAIFEGQKGARKKALAMFAEYADDIWW